LKKIKKISNTLPKQARDNDELTGNTWSASNPSNRPDQPDFRRSNTAQDEDKSTGNTWDVDDLANTPDVRRGEGDKDNDENIGNSWSAGIAAMTRKEMETKQCNIPRHWRVKLFHQWYGRELALRIVWLSNCLSAQI
jgi:hypothetical protein